MSPNSLVFDTWTPISFKRGMSGVTTYTAPGWADWHSRRLTAYTILKAYVDNSARHFLQNADQEEIDAHREYGDAGLLTEQVRSAVMGEDQDIVTPEEEDDDEEYADWLRQWAKDERFWHKMIEVERDSCELGDGVYVLGWSETMGRPTIQVYDPGFYFPVIDPSIRGSQYPDKVHIAWEYEDDGKRFVRRITWELVQGEPYRPAYADEQTTTHCLMSDGIWELEDFEGIDEALENRAQWMTNEDGLEIQQLDIGIDFIPVIHIPNAVSTKEHFGRSVLSRVLQILDDISNADTDLQAAAATTGTPPISLSGADMQGTLSYSPGQVFKIGDGRMDVLDTSKSLDALLKYTDRLLDRLSTNSRLPAAALGRIDASDVPSGIALALSFGPLKSMVDEMRLVRDDKYGLLLKMVWRFAKVGQMEDAPEQRLDARVTFGPYMPQDLSGTVNLVTSLLEKGAISLETGVQMLLEAGVPAGSVVEEIERIQQRDFDGANELLDATGNQDLVNTYLGVKSPETDPAEPGGAPSP